MAKLKTIIKVFDRLVDPPKDPLKDFQIWVIENPVPKGNLVRDFLRELGKKTKDANLKTKLLGAEKKSTQYSRIWQLLMYGIFTNDPKSIREFFESLEALGIGFPDDVENLFWSNAKIGETEARNFMNLKGDRERTVLRQTDFGSVFMKAFNKLWEQYKDKHGNVYLWGMLSRMFAAESTGDVHCFFPKGLVVGNFFWNDELPVLRELQREGIVEKILIHIYEGNQWQPLFEIDDGALCIIGAQDYDPLRHKERKVQANQTKIDNFIEFEKQIDVQKLKRLLLYNNTLGPFSVIFREFRYRTWTIAKMCYAGSYQIELSNPRHPTIHKKIVAKTISFVMLHTLEHFLLANYKDFIQLPNEIEVINDGIAADGSIIVIKCRVMSVVKLGDNKLMNEWIYINGIDNLIMSASPPQVDSAIGEFRKTQFLMLNCLLSSSSNAVQKLHALVHAIADSTYKQQIPLADRIMLLRNVVHNLGGQRKPGTKSIISPAQP